jgi:hypothetical protein
MPSTNSRFSRAAPILSEEYGRDGLRLGVEEVAFKKKTVQLIKQTHAKLQITTPHLYVQVVNLYLLNGQIHADANTTSRGRKFMTGRVRYYMLFTWLVSSAASGQIILIPVK